MTHLGIPGLALLCGVAAFGLGQKLLGIPWQHSLSFATLGAMAISLTYVFLFLLHSDKCFERSHTATAMPNRPLFGLALGAHGIIALSGVWAVAF